MKIPAVMFAASQPCPTFHATELDLATAADLQALRGDGLPSAYIVRAPNLAGLRELKPHIIDRGSKHPAKPLAKLLLGYDKPVLIDGEFKSVVQLKHSVNSLLANAHKAGDRNLYFIGAPAALFVMLCRQAIPRLPAMKSHVDLGKQSLFEQLRDQPVDPKIVEGFVGVSEHADFVRHLIMCAARTDVPVFIQGESGTGKEVVARLIHENSAREFRNFVAINCAAIPAALFESELFGHEPGAFTDAKTQKLGHWEFADGGTLFLDEIGDLDPAHQAKILRVMDEGKFRKVGGNKEIQSDARIIAATNRDLTEMIRAGKFREDLFYRLFVWRILTAPLRDHPEDIPPLAQHFWRGAVTKDKRATLPDDVLTELQTYRWPGNARELRAVLLRLHVLTTNKQTAPTVSLLRSVFYPLPS